MGGPPGVPGNSKPRSPALGPWSLLHPTPGGSISLGSGGSMLFWGGHPPFLQQDLQVALRGGLQLLHIHSQGGTLGVQQGDVAGRHGQGVPSPRHLGRDLELHSRGRKGPPAPQWALCPTLAWAALRCSPQLSTLRNALPRLTLSPKRDPDEPPHTWQRLDLGET